MSSYSSLWVSLILALGVAASAAGCYDADVFDIDAACVPETLAAGQEYDLLVIESCRGCDELGDFSCSVTVDGDQIELEATIETRPMRGACGAMCDSSLTGYRVAVVGCCHNRLY